MSVALTDPVDVRREAARGRHIEATLSLAQLPRLVELTHADGASDAPIAVELELALDEARRAVVTGRLAAQLTLVCERCLGPVSHTLDLPVKLRSGELPEGDFSLEEGPLRLAALLEDEALLAIGSGVRHADGQACAAEAARYIADDAKADTDMRTPFAGLKDLLSSDD
jgi:uncharacterized protein